MQVMLNFSQELALKWLAKEHTDKHRAPKWSDMYSYVIDMVMTEERAVKCMKALQDKKCIIVHKDLVMFQRYFDEFYNEDFCTLNAKYDYKGVTSSNE